MKIKKVVCSKYGIVSINENCSNCSHYHRKRNAAFNCKHMIKTHKEQNL